MREDSLPFWLGLSHDQLREELQRALDRGEVAASHEAAIHAMVAHLEREQTLAEDEIQELEATVKDLTAQLERIERQDATIDALEHKLDAAQADARRAQGEADAWRERAEAADEPSPQTRSRKETTPMAALNPDTLAAAIAEGIVRGLAPTLAALAALPAATEPAPNRDAAGAPVSAAVDAASPEPDGTWSETAVRDLLIQLAERGGRAQGLALVEAHAQAPKGQRPKLSHVPPDRLPVLGRAVMDALAASVGEAA